MSAQAKQCGRLTVALATVLGVVSGVALAISGFKLPQPAKGGSERNGSLV
jgi:hypothetical protein